MAPPPPLSDATCYMHLPSLRHSPTVPPALLCVLLLLFAAAVEEEEENSPKAQQAHDDQVSSNHTGSAWCSRGRRWEDYCCPRGCGQCCGRTCQGACCGTYIRRLGRVCRRVTDTTCRIPDEEAPAAAAATVTTATTATATERTAATTATEGMGLCANRAAEDLLALSATSAMTFKWDTVDWKDLTQRMLQCIERLEGSFWEIILSPQDWPGIFEILLDAQTPYSSHTSGSPFLYAFLCTHTRVARGQGMDPEPSCTATAVIQEVLPLLAGEQLVPGRQVWQLRDLQPPLGTAWRLRGGDDWQRELQPLLSEYQRRAVSRSRGRGRGGSEAPRQRVAVCIAGLARSFASGRVYESIARNATGLLDAEVSFFYVLDLQKRSFSEFSDALSRLPPSGMAFYYGDEGGTDWDAQLPCRWTGPPCHKQWQKLHTCFKLVEAAEASSGRRFDWLMRLRPDVRWHAPIGPLRDYDPSVLHITVRGTLPYADPVDLFALVPREFAEAYFNVNCPSLVDVRYADCEGYTATPEGDLISCTCECALKAWLVRRNVQIDQFPPIYSIVREEQCYEGDTKCLEGWS